MTTSGTTFAPSCDSARQGRLHLLPEKGQKRLKVLGKGRKKRHRFARHRMADRKFLRMEHDPGRVPRNPLVLFPSIDGVTQKDMAERFQMNPYLVGAAGVQF